MQRCPISNIWSCQVLHRKDLDNNWITSGCSLLGQDLSEWTQVHGKFQRNHEDQVRRNPSKMELHSITEPNLKREVISGLFVSAFVSNRESVSQ